MNMMEKALREVLAAIASNPKYYSPPLDAVASEVAKEVKRRVVKLAYAIDLFVRGIVSVERAAELSLYDFILELQRRGITAYPYNDEELREELGIE